MWAVLTVEGSLAVWVLVLLAADVIVPAARKASLWLLALAGIGAALGLLAATPLSWVNRSFQGMFLLDRFAIYYKWLFLLTGAVVVVMTRHFDRHRLAHPGAFFMLLFTALLGMLILASINDLLLLFIGLELLTFSLYVMTAYLKTEPKAIEAGMKYLILGSVSGGFLVYGISLLYGATGGTSFDVLRAALSAAGPVPWNVQAGMLLVLAALGFKVAMVPFHLWVPDVYEGAPTPVVALLSVGSKMAGIVAILRVFFGVFAPLQAVWANLVAVLAAATMLYGNLGALAQTNIKRLLGYSSISHAGYLLMGVSTASAAGATAVGYYLLAYLASNLTVFLAVAAASEAVGGDGLDGYNGLSKRSPLLAASLFIGLLSLAGVPPLAGFIGKLLVLLATMESGRLWLVVVGSLNVAISLYYYLMVVRRMYLLPPTSHDPIAVDGPTRFVCLALVISVLLIGVFQEPFLQQIALAVLR